MNHLRNHGKNKSGQPTYMKIGYMAQLISAQCNLFSFYYNW